MQNFPSVLVEAMVCGTPVVATDCASGPAEVLENGVYGPLVPVGNTDALAAAIAKTLERRSESDVLKQRASGFGVSESVHPNLITNWKKQAREQVLAGFSGKHEHQEITREAEIKELRAKVGELVIERDFLSKAFGR